jgi:hypothetical protein
LVHAYSIKLIGAQDIDNALSPILRAPGHSFFGISPLFAASPDGTIGFADLFSLGFVSLIRDVFVSSSKQQLSDQILLYIVWNILLSFFADRFLSAVLRGVLDLADFSCALGMMVLLGGSFAYRYATG